MAQCDVQSLMTSAKCFACLPPGFLGALELQLLCEINNTINNINPGNFQEVFPGHYGAAPPAFVPLLNRGMAPDLDAPFVLWTWNPDTQTWQ